MKKFSLAVLTAISTLFIIWGVLSTAEVAIKNNNPNPQYSQVNLWTLIVKEAK